MSGSFGPGPWGPGGVPFDDVPDGEEFSITDPTHPHDSDKYGRHYDSDLYRRIGSDFERIDKMHIDPHSGDILDR